MSISLTHIKGSSEIAFVKDKSDGEEKILQKIYMTGLYGGKKDQVSKKDNRIFVEDNILEVEGIGDGNEDLTLELSPEKEKNQNIRILVVGASGSGKSYMIGTFLNNYNKRYPKQDIFLFSRHEYDPSLDGRVKALKRVTVTEEEAHNAVASKTELFPIESLSNSIVIFDDTFSAGKRFLNKFYVDLSNDLSTNARKYNIDLCYIIHNSNYGETRLLFSEATHIILFFGSNESMNKRLLKTYAGMNEVAADNLMKIEGSRYVIIKIPLPKFIMTDKYIFRNGDIPYILSLNKEGSVFNN